MSKPDDGAPIENQRWQCITIQDGGLFVNYWVPLVFSLLTSTQTLPITKCEKTSLTFFYFLSHDQRKPEAFDKLMLKLSVPVTFFTQGVMKTILGAKGKTIQGLLRVVTRVSNGTPYNFNY